MEDDPHSAVAKLLIGAGPSFLINCIGQMSKHMGADVQIPDKYKGKEN